MESATLDNMNKSAVSIAVRKARLDDAEALVRIFRETWHSAYNGIIPTLHLARLIQRRDVAWWRASIRAEKHLFVLEVATKIVGYASCGPARNKKSKHGEIYELYITPLYQGMGLGEHLFEACRHQLDIDQLEGMIVWALEDNVSAQDFYWRQGGRPKGKSRESFSGKTLSKVAYAWG